MRGSRNVTVVARLIASRQVTVLLLAFVSRSSSRRIRHLICAAWRPSDTSARAWSPLGLRDETEMNFDEAQRHLVLEGVEPSVGYPGALPPCCEHARSLESEFGVVHRMPWGNDSSCFHSGPGWHGDKHVRNTQTPRLRTELCKINLKLRAVAPPGVVQNKS
jgi:hypothetical protein